MTNPTMKLVPAEPTEEMKRRLLPYVREDIADANDWVLPVLISSSPHAGQVSWEQVEQVAGQITACFRAHHLTLTERLFLVRLVVTALGLQVEEE